MISHLLKDGSRFKKKKQKKPHIYMQKKMAALNKSKTISLGLGLIDST